MEKETIYAKDFERIFNGEKLEEESIDIDDSIKVTDLSEEARQIISKKESEKKDKEVSEDREDKEEAKDSE